MVADFFETTIGEQVTLQRGFDITKKEQQPGDVPVVSSGGISSFHNQTKVQGPGVVLGRKGSLGTVFYLTDDYWPHDTTLWVKDFKNNNPRFVYYFFRNMGEALKKMDVGAANPALNRNHVHPLPVVWPTRKVQDRIVEQAAILDDKIQLNRQTNQTLESMAQALFKSWFVDFDPVIDNALAAGNAIPEPLQARAEQRKALQCSSDALDGQAVPQLPEAIRQLFSNSFVLDAEMGWIPEGWEIKSLDKIAHYQNGLALQKFRPENDNEFLPVVKIAQLKKGYADGEEKASPNISPSCILDDGDVVFSWSGSLMVDVWCGGKAALNQHLFKVTSKTYPKWFYLWYTKHHLLEFQRIASDKAVTMGHIKRSHLSDAKCAVPPIGLLKCKANIMPYLLDREIALRLQTAELANLRDILLPKLISGELRIPEAAQAAQELEATTA